MTDHQPKSEELVAALGAAFDWIRCIPHDEYCFTNEPDEAGLCCACGKESILGRIAELLPDEDAALPSTANPADPS